MPRYLPVETADGGVQYVVQIDEEPQPPDPSLIILAEAMQVEESVPTAIRVQEMEQPVVAEIPQTPSQTYQPLDPTPVEPVLVRSFISPRVGSVLPFSVNPNAPLHFIQNRPQSESDYNEMVPVVYEIPNEFEDPFTTVLAEFVDCSEELPTEPVPHPLEMEGQLSFRQAALTNLKSNSNQLSAFNHNKIQSPSRKKKRKFPSRDIMPYALPISVLKHLIPHRRDEHLLVELECKERLFLEEMFSFNLSELASRLSVIQRFNSSRRKLLRKILPFHEDIKQRVADQRTFERRQAKEMKHLVNAYQRPTMEIVFNEVHANALSLDAIRRQWARDLQVGMG